MDGEPEDANVGTALGSTLCSIVGNPLGAELDSSDGDSECAVVGTVLSSIEGTLECSMVGTLLGCTDRIAVGGSLG